MVADQVTFHDLNTENQEKEQEFFAGNGPVQNKENPNQAHDYFQSMETYQHDENDNLERDYVLYSQGLTLMSVTPISIKDSPDINNHIVLCGIHPSIYYFILPLRANYLKEFQPIVILSEEKPTSIWDTINRFPKISYIKGSPLIIEDLIRANICNAAKAVILG
jgi:hypothetical protein